MKIYEKPMQISFHEKPVWIFFIHLFKWVLNLDGKRLDFYKADMLGCIKKQEGTLM